MNAIALPCRSATHTTTSTQHIGSDQIIYIPINVETRRQSPTEGDPLAALAQISRLYTYVILTKNSYPNRIGLEGTGFFGSKG